MYVGTIRCEGRSRMLSSGLQARERIQSSNYDANILLRCSRISDRSFQGSEGVKLFTLYGPHLRCQNLKVLQLEPVRRCLDVLKELESLAMYQEDPPFDQYVVIFLQVWLCVLPFLARLRGREKVIAPFLPKAPFDIM
ncbi:hypothetical protein TNCV_414511 [Trichonephila clavipes]|nr:hypothetical protein TNCV_414511 [Trichonephila clavipes]